MISKTDLKDRAWIPLKDRVHILATSDRRFIESLFSAQQQQEILAEYNGITTDISERLQPETKEIYFRDFSIRVYSNDESEKVAMQLASATSLEEIGELVLRVYSFTISINGAMEFSFEDIYGEIKTFSEMYNINFFHRVLDKEYLPF